MPLTIRGLKSVRAIFRSAGRDPQLYRLNNVTRAIHSRTLSTEFRQVALDLTRFVASLVEEGRIDLVSLAFHMWEKELAPLVRAKEEAEKAQRGAESSLVQLRESMLAGKPAKTPQVALEMPAEREVQRLRAQLAGRLSVRESQKLKKQVAQLTTERDEALKAKEEAGQMPRQLAVLRRENSSLRLENKDLISERDAFKKAKRKLERALAGAKGTIRRFVQSLEEMDHEARHWLLFILGMIAKIDSQVEREKAFFNVLAAVDHYLRKGFPDIYEHKQSVLPPVAFLVKTIYELDDEGRARVAEFLQQFKSPTDQPVGEKTTAISLEDVQRIKAEERAAAAQPAAAPRPHVRPQSITLEPADKEQIRQTSLTAQQFSEMPPLQQLRLTHQYKFQLGASFWTQWVKNAVEYLATENPEIDQSRNNDNELIAFLSQHCSAYVQIIFHKTEKGAMEETALKLLKLIPAATPAQQQPARKGKGFLGRAVAAVTGKKNGS